MKLLSLSGVVLLLLLISTYAVHSVAQQPPDVDPLDLAGDVDEPFAAPVQTLPLLFDGDAEVTPSTGFAPSLPAQPAPARVGNVPAQRPSPMLDLAGPGNDPRSTNRNTSQQQQLGEAVRALQNPESSDEQRSTAREFVQQALRQQFETDLENRQKQLAAMEKQLTRLREQLAKRAEAMEKLVDLRLQLLENEASGLAFPEEWSRLPGTTGGRAAGMGMGMMGGEMGAMGMPMFPKPAARSGSPDVFYDDRSFPPKSPDGVMPPAGSLAPRPFKPDSSHENPNRPAVPVNPNDDFRRPPSPSSPKMFEDSFGT